MEEEIKKEDIKKFSDDYCILDPSQVCGIFPLIQKNIPIECIKEIDTKRGFFKKIDTPKILQVLSSNFDLEETIIIEDTKYSKDYIDGIIKMGSVWFSRDPDILMTYDKEKQQFIKDGPVMFIFGSKLCFMLAPRIESGD